MFSIHEIIDIAIKLEKNGENIYRTARELTNDISLKDLLEWVASEELSHTEWLIELKNEVEPGEDHHLAAEISQALVGDFVGDQTFSLNDVDFSKTENTEDLMQIFIDFENDTIVFYEMLKSFITDKKTIEKLDQIIDQEKSHIKKFQELLPNVPYDNGSARENLSP